MPCNLVSLILQCEIEKQSLVVVGWIMTPVSHTGMCMPSSWNLQMLLYMARKTLQMWLGKGSWDEKINPNYLGRPCVVTEVFVTGRQEIRWIEGYRTKKAVFKMPHYWLWKRRKRSRVKEGSFMSWKRWIKGFPLLKIRQQAPNGVA